MNTPMTDAHIRDHLAGSDEWAYSEALGVFVARESHPDGRSRIVRPSEATGRYRLPPSEWHRLGFADEPVDGPVVVGIEVPGHPGRLRVFWLTEPMLLVGAVANGATRAAEVALMGGEE